MIEKFIDFIQTNQLFNLKEPILLAVSGGVDSVVMSHLFYKSGLNFGIAHINFKLRGDDSDEDMVGQKKEGERGTNRLVPTRDDRRRFRDTFPK